VQIQYIRDNTRLLWGLYFTYEELKHVIVFY